MKKISLFITIGLFFNCSNAYTQTSNKGEQLKKIKTYINYKIINNYLDQATNQSQYKDLRKAYEDNKKNLIKNPIKQNGSDNELLNLLNKNFQTFHLEDVIQISDINLEELSSKPNEVSVVEMTDKILAKINSHKNPTIRIENINDIKEDAIIEYNKMSNELSQNLELDDRNKPNSDIKDNGTTSENTNSNFDKTKNKEQNMELHEQAEFFSISGFNIWNLITILISLFSLILTFFLTRKNKKQTSNTLETPAVTEKIQSTTQSTSFGTDEFEKYLQRSSKIKEICTDIYILKNKPEPIELNTVKNVEIREPQNVTENANHSENVFYMIQPIDDTYFSISNMQQSKMGTVYKFIINNNNKNDATFEVISDGVDPNEIAKRNQNIIKPACNEDNIPGSIVRRIITLKPGHVSLEDDKWIIKTKAVIKYE